MIVIVICLCLYLYGCMSDKLGCLSVFVSDCLFVCLSDYCSYLSALYLGLSDYCSYLSALYVGLSDKCGFLSMFVFKCVSV